MIHQDPLLFPAPDYLASSPIHLPLALSKAWIDEAQPAIAYTIYCYL